MAAPNLPAWMNPERAREIAQLRALGYKQTDIAAELGVNQGTVSRYLRGLNEAAAESNESTQDFLLGLLLGAAGMAVILQIADKMKERQRRYQYL